ncbi:MAG: beta strand repeat-containing protein, partial [Bradyrhizobium sp.]
MTTIPAYTIGGLTRPELQLDSTGHIILDSAAQAFADTYGLQYLYLGCPPGTPWPPVSDSLSTPVDANSGNNTISEGAAANTLVNITAQAVSSSGNPVTYSLTGDTSHGGFKIDPNTGVVSVADPTKVNYVTSPGHAYTITVQASDGIATSSQSFVIGVTDVAPSTPVDSNAAPNKVAEGSAAGTLVGITASAADMNAVTYTLTGDTSGGGFKIDPNTGVITVADPSKIDYTTAPGHAYTVTATASDGTLSSSQTFTIAVTLGAATHFSVSIPANGAAGTPGSVTVTALDSLNHVVTNYTGTVHFTSSDGHAVLPADVTLTNGTGSFSETLDTAGSQTITATDTANSTVTGTSNAEIVTPGIATHFSVNLPANGTAGTPGSVTVTALDAFGNVATGYTGTVHFTSTDGTAVLPADTMLTNGVGTFSETLDTAGSQTITATDTVAAAITGTSNAETVKGGAATHLVVSIPANGAAGTPGTVTVTALDAFGNVATGYTGTVHFTSTDGHAVLPANMTLTNGVGTFSETFGTVGSQTITATDTVSAAITGTSNAETVAPGPATHFVVSIPANGTAGTPGSVTVTALDAGNNIATGYSGTVHFTSTDGQAVLPADVTLTNGVGTFSETLDTAGSQTITATDTAHSAVTGTSNPETVIAGAVTHFAVAIPANGTAGTAGSGTVTALDAFGNVVTGYTGTVHFTSTDAGAVLPADMTLTNGIGTFSETFKTAGSQTVIATDTLHGAITGTSNAETVAGAAATLLVVSIPGNGAAGTPGTVTVTALDAFGNVATGYTGTVHFTSSDGHAVLPANMTLTNGTGSFSETFETAGTQTITATDTLSAGITGTSNAETVAPGPAMHFVVTLQTPGTAGVAGSATITALDAFGNVATGYAGTVHFTSSDGQAVLPANMTLTNGTATFSETLDTAGSQTITATDTVNSAITGTSNTETVTAAAITHFAVTLPANGTAGTAGSGTVTALDAFNNVVTGYSGTVHFTSTDASAVLPADMTLTNGIATFSETFDTAGSQTITATDTVAAAITGTSNAETVAPGAATHFVVTIPANGRADIPGTVTVIALDAHNNVATGYSGTVHFTSSDGSAVLPSNMTLTNGTFSETFGTAGTQTITATDTVNSGITGTSNSETVAPPDAPPVVTAGHTLSYIEAQPATAFDPALTVTDSDSANLAHATVQITGNYVAGEDVLAFTPIGAITGSFDAVHGILTLTGSDTVAHYQAALDSVTYVNTSNNPSGLARTVTIIANDGILDSTPVTDTIDVTPVNNPPVVTFGAITNFSEPPVGTPPANSVPVTIAPNLTITDVDSTNLISATFVLNDLKPSDALSIAGHAGTSGDIGNIHFDISSTATTETVTLTGTDTIAHYNAVLDAVQFNNTGEPPDTTARTYTVTAQDDGGTANGGHDTGSAGATQTVTAIDDPPTATVPSDSSVGTAFSHTNLAISGLSVGDIDSAGGNETATITSNHGALNFDTTGLASFTNNGSHSVTLTGTIAQLNTALATLNYNSDDGFTGSDTVTLNINDNSHTGTGGPLTSGPQSFHIGVVPQVFYIDNSAAGSHNLGTQADPYTSIAAFNAANPAGSGDYVVLEHGTGTYSEANGINLANGVNLIGGSHTLQFTNPVTGATVTANAGSGTDPVIHVTGADNGVDLLGTSGHTITGVSIDTSAGTGI